MIDALLLAAFSAEMQKEASPFRVKGLAALRHNLPKLKRPRLTRPFSGNKIKLTKVGAVNPVHLTLGTAGVLGVGATARATKDAVKNRYDDQLPTPGITQGLRSAKRSLTAPPG